MGSDCVNLLGKTTEEEEEAADFVKQKQSENTSLNASPADNSWEFALFPTGCHKYLISDHGAGLTSCVIAVFLSCIKKKWFCPVEWDKQSVCPINLKFTPQGLFSNGVSLTDWKDLGNRSLFFPLLLSKCRVFHSYIVFSLHLPVPVC